MTQIVANQYPDEGARFAPNAFDQSVGVEVPFKIDDRVIGTSVLLGYTVAEDGSYATMTFEIPDGVIKPDTRGLSIVDEENGS